MTHALGVNEAISTSPGFLGVREMKNEMKLIRGLKWQTGTRQCVHKEQTHTPHTQCLLNSLQGNGL